MAKWGPLGARLLTGAFAIVASLAAAAPAGAEFEFLGQWGGPGTGEVVAATHVDQDIAGNTYVLDALNGRVHKLDSANQPVLSWGVLTPGEQGFVAALGVNANTGVVYVGYLLQGQGGSPAKVAIRRFDSSGALLGEFGSFGNAEGQFGEGMSGISVDRVTGRVYVSEGHRVQRFTGTGQFQRMWGRDVDPAGGTGAEICTAGCKAAITGTAEGEFTFPSDVATDGPRVYVVEDTTKRVQRFSADGTFERMAGRNVDPGGGTGAEVCLTNCQAGMTGTALGELEEPAAIDVSSALGIVYVVDGGNHRVQRWQIDLSPVGEFGSEGTADGQFQAPVGLGEQGGRVVVTDVSLLRIQQFDSVGAFQARFGEPAPSTLVVPEAIGVGGGGVYVTDFRQRVVRYDAGGSFISTWGAPGSAVGEFSFPAGVTVDGSGEVYVADAFNARIQRFDQAGSALGAWGTPGTGDGQFDTPVDVATAGGSVYTLESGNSRIQRFSPIGSFQGTWGAGGTQPGQFFARGIGTDQAGNVYVADAGNNRIQKFSSDGALLAVWGGLGSGPGELDSPADVAVDGLGNVFVADRDNDRVVRFDSSGAYVGEWGANGEGPGSFRDPISIAVDPTGDIYVAEQTNNRVQKFARANSPPEQAIAVPPDLELSGPKRLRPAKLRVKVACGAAPCVVALGGKVATRKAGKLKRKLKPNEVDLAAGESATVAVKIQKQKKSARKLAAALRRGAKGKATIRGEAENSAGSDSDVFRAKLKR